MVEAGRWRCCWLIGPLISLLARAGWRARGAAGGGAAILPAESTANTDPTLQTSLKCCFEDACHDAIEKVRLPHQPSCYFKQSLTVTHSRLSMACLLYINQACRFKFNVRVFKSDNKQQARARAHA